MRQTAHEGHESITAAQAQAATIQVYRTNRITYVRVTYNENRPNDDWLVSRHYSTISICSELIKVRIERQKWNWLNWKNNLSKAQVTRDSSGPAALAISVGLQQ